MNSDTVGMKKTAGLHFALCFLAGLLLLSALSADTCADDKFHGYEIYSTTSEYGSYYSVYTPEDVRNIPSTVRHSAIGPTFSTFSEDIYTGKDSNIRITIYHGLDLREEPEVSHELAQVFADYIANKSTAKHKISGWFCLPESNSEYSAYLIEGWDASQELDELVLQTYVNSKRYTLNLMNFGHGDITMEKGKWILDEMGYSLAAWLPVKNPRDGVTVGFFFIDLDWMPYY